MQRPSSSFPLANAFSRPATVHKITSPSQSTLALNSWLGGLALRGRVVIIFLYSWLIPDYANHTNIMGLVYLSLGDLETISKEWQGELKTRPSAVDAKLKSLLHHGTIWGRGSCGQGRTGPHCLSAFNYTHQNQTHKFAICVCVAQSAQVNECTIHFRCIAIRGRQRSNVNAVGVAIFLVNIEHLCC